MANVEVSKGLSVEGPSALHGGVSLAQLKVRAGKTIALPSGASAFVTVSDDGAEEANELTLAAPADGQLLILSNSDAHPTSGIARVPSGSVVLLVYDGAAALWRDVHALHAPVEVRPEPYITPIGRNHSTTCGHKSNHLTGTQYFCPHNRSSKA